MNEKKRKHNPDVQGALWPLDEFDQPDTDNMTPTDEPLFDDLEGIIYNKNDGCSCAGEMECPEDCSDCVYSG